MSEQLPRAGEEPERLRLLHPAELTPMQSALRERIVGGRRAGQPFRMCTDQGELLGPFNALLYSPALGEAVQQVGEMLRFDGVLPAQLRELVILTVATECGSAYEWYAHSRVARSLGVPESLIDTISRGQRPADGDGAEIVAVRVGQELIREGSVTDEAYRQARCHFDEEEMVELTALIGYYRLLADLLAMFDTGALDGPA